MAKSKFLPEHKELEHQIILDAPINKVFRLFTPLEMKKWEQDWDPQYLYPENGKMMEDAIFTTRSDNGSTIWLVKMYTTYKHHIAYHRVTPGKVAGMVNIKCNPYGEQTRATVRHTFTTLSQEGGALLQDWTPDFYRSYIEQWRKKINHYLKTGQMLPEE